MDLFLALRITTSISEYSLCVCLLSPGHYT